MSDDLSNDETLDNQFGAVIVQLRKARKWSQVELGAKSGIHRAYIGAIERGEKSVTLGTANRLAKAFDLSLGQLIMMLDREIINQP